MKLLSVMLSLLVVSPIWPLGQNPTYGDPFIIVNKATNQLAFIDEGEIKNIYPAATGTTEKLTPEGKFTITVKAKDPYYRKKDIPGGTNENPLGTRWIGFDALETDGRTYGIHGNNNPKSIGKYITQGCIRLYEKDIQDLYEQVPIGTTVVILTTDSSFEEIARKYGAIK